MFDPYSLLVCSTWILKIKLRRLAWKVPGKPTQFCHKTLSRTYLVISGHVVNSDNRHTYAIDVATKVLVNKKWGKMEASMKAAWKSCDDKLYQRPVPGQFLSLPPSVNDPAGFVCRCLREETFYLWKLFKTALMLRNKISIKNQAVYFPLQLKIGSHRYHLLSISAMFRFCLMENLFLYKWEKVVNRRYNKHFHVSSKQRACNFFSMEDCCFVKSTDHNSSSTFYFTSFSLLKGVPEVDQE